MRAASEPSTAERHLREGVYAVVVGDDLALLDIDADGYLCLPGAADTVRSSPDGVVSFLPGPASEAIDQAGLAAAAPPTARKAPPPLPQRTIIHDHDAVIALADGVRALYAVADVRRALRGVGLRPILDVAGPPRRASDPETVIEAARTFARLHPWLPIEGECLVRSATLMSFLRRAGLVADWVFAVRLWPFSAHCWVQAGDVCLNDDIERLAAYTPIYCR